MREIKFRAWDYETEKMFHHEDIIDGEWMYYDLYSDHQWELMQFTGLKDKNGKEIYQGDIVRSGEKGTVYNAGIGMVEFVANNSAGYPINGYWANCMNDRDCSTIWPDNVEVIGNIYENPELLGKEAA